MCLLHPWDQAGGWNKEDPPLFRDCFFVPFSRVIPKISIDIFRGCFQEHITISYRLVFIVVF